MFISLDPWFTWINFCIIMEITRLSCSLQQQGYILFSKIDCKI